MGQLKALLYKNWVVYKRNKFTSLLQVLVPIAAIMIVVFPIRNLFTSTSYPSTFFMSSSPPSNTFSYSDSFSATSFRSCNGTIAALIPQGDILVSVLNTKLSSKITTKIFKTEEEFDTYIRSQTYAQGGNPGICFGVVVKSSANKDYRINLRFNASSTPSTLLLNSNSLFDATNFRRYPNSQFTQLQTTISNSVLQLEGGSASIRNIISPIAQQAYTVDNLYTRAGAFLDILPIFSLLIVFLQNVYRIVQQKQSRMKYTMEIMGVSKLGYFVSWIIRFYSVYIVISIVAAILLPRLTTRVDRFVYLVLYLLYGLVLCVQANFISIFFSRPKLASSVASLYYALQYIIVLTVKDKFQIPYTTVFWVCLIPQAAFSLVFQAFIYASSNGLPVNLTSLQDVILNVQISSFFILAAVAIVGYIILIWYLQQVFPNQLGTNKHPLFFLGFTKSPTVVEDICEQNEKDFQKVEQIKQQEKISVQNLRKTFGEKVAVQGLSLELFTGQVFSFLGHNGAGKTTTISMLSGVIEPSAGSANYFGLDLVKNLNQVRKIIGYCPQHNTLFEDLTVQQHLYFFLNLKQSEGDSQLNQLIHDVNLTEKRDCQAKVLSGGQKRKLCLAISFVGGSKVVFLDQPTSGMDTYSRRFVWQMIRKNKNGRVIILTTHFMDQADYLGDRVGIIDKGVLKALGSPLFLKSRFGIGYSLVIAKKNSAVLSQPILNAIRASVPGLQVVTDASCEISLQLPTTEVQKFPALFSNLQKQKNKLQIQSYGISITSLQDVFMRVCSVSQVYNDQKSTDQFKGVANIQFMDSGCALFWAQVAGTIIKKMRYLRKSIKSLLYQFLLPILILALGISLGNLNPIKDFPSIGLNQTLYPSFQPYNALNLPINNSVNFTVSSNTPLEFDQLTFGLKSKTMLYSTFKTQVGSVYNIYSQAMTNLTHSPAIMVAESNAALLRSLLSNNISLSFNNHPLVQPISRALINGLISGTLVAFIILIAISFVLSSFAVLLVKQRQCGSKDIQFICGMSPGAYWLGNWVVDLIKIVVVLAACFGLLIAYDVKGLIEGDALAALGLSLILFCYSSIPFTYVISFFFQEYGNAQSGVYLISLLSGAFLPVFLLIFWVLGSSSTPIQIVSWILRIMPTYAFGDSLLLISSVSLINFVQKSNYTVFSLSIATGDLIMMAVLGTVYWILLLVIEKAKVSCSSLSSNSIPAQLNSDHQQDVSAEEAYTLKASKEAIIAKMIRKVYQDGADSKVAVEKVSFVVSQGEIFGLLGTNGAGKTTTFKMLAGQLTPTQGQIHLKGIDLYSNVTTARKLIGYCPQHDALLDLLSPRQHLQLLATIKGIKSSHIQQSVIGLIELLALIQYQHVNSQELSGGNKRKLSLAISLLGSPPIIYLDEPSSGMDPASRRFMWKIIAWMAQSQNCSIVLTTHSMQEAEALSSKIAIMVDGSFKCIGTPQHIKSKYGDGYQLQIKLDFSKLREKIDTKSPVTDLDGYLKGVGLGKQQLLNQSASQIDLLFERKDFNAMKLIIQAERTSKAIKKAIQSQNFKMSLIQHFGDYFRFKASAEKKDIGQLFGIIQKLKDKMNIAQYSIKQATVEQIFNKFADKAQHLQQ